MLSSGTQQMWKLLGLMIALASTPVAAKVIECPDGSLHEVADTLEAPCVELCSDGTRIVLGRDACPPGAQVIDTTDGVMDLIGSTQAEFQPLDWVRLRNSILGLLAMLVGVGLYVAPTLIARVRRHGRTAEILLVNLLLGWTGVGWIAALLWSLRGTASDAVVPQR